MDDLIAMLAGGNIDPKAFAAALRKQKLVGMLTGGVGDPVLDRSGAALAKDAQGKMDTLIENQQQAPQRSLRMALEQQALAKGQRQEQDAQAAQAPEAVSLKRALAKRFGLDATNAPAQALDSLLPLAEKGWAAEQSATARRDSLAAQREDRSARALERKDALEFRTSEKESQLADKQFIALGDAVNLARGRQGEAGKAMGTIQQAKRDLQLIEQNPNPSEQQLYEIARGLDRVISGAAPTIGATEHLVPQTLRGKVANFEQWLRNKPTGAEKQEFVKQYKDTLERISAATVDFTNDTNAKTFNSRSHLAKRDPERWNAAITAAGLSPEDFDQKTWVYKGKPKAQPSTDDAAAIEWAKAHPDDPRATAIMKLHGAAP